MKFHFKFKSLQYSSALVELFESRLERLEKLELKPLDVHVTFSAERHNKKINIYINGLGKVLIVHTSADTFQKSIDMACNKLMRQMLKEKSKVKHHKRTVRLIAEANTPRVSDSSDLTDFESDQWGVEEDKIAS